MSVNDRDPWEEAVNMCKSILHQFVPEHERIELMIHFYVFTPRSGEPLIARTPEEALKEALEQDKVEAELEDKEKDWNVRAYL